MAGVDEGRLRQWLSRYQNSEVALRDILSVTNHYQGLSPLQETYKECKGICVIPVTNCIFAIHNFEYSIGTVGAHEDEAASCEQTGFPTSTARYILPFQSLIQAEIFNDGTPMDLVNLSGTIPVTYKGNTYNIPICIWLIDTHPKNAPICYVKPTSDMSIKPSLFVDQNGKIYLPYLHDWVPGSSELLGLIQVMIVTFGEQPPVFAKPKDSEVPYPTNVAFMPQPGGYAAPYPMTSFPQPSLGFGGGGGAPGGAGGGHYPPYPPAPTTTAANHNLPYPGFGGGGGGGGGGFPAPYPPYGSGGGGSLPTPNNSGTIKDEHIRESLLTAIEEKLMRRMREQFQQNQAELETLKRTHEELKQGKAKLNAMLARMEKEQNDLDKNITVLKDKEQELDKAIERLSNEEPIDVDDAVTTTAPLYKQLLNAFAEEAALEDAIYYMGEALRCGVIDLDVFLRQVRTLSRKQFVLRALMQKCRQKAGLSV